MAATWRDQLQLTSALPSSLPKPLYLKSKLCMWRLLTLPNTPPRSYLPHEVWQASKWHKEPHIDGVKHGEQQQGDDLRCGVMGGQHAW